MTELNPKVKRILERLHVLLNQKAFAVAHGVYAGELEIEIGALMGAVKILEGQGNG